MFLGGFIGVKIEVKDINSNWNKNGCCAACIRSEGIDDSWETSLCSLHCLAR